MKKLLSIKSLWRKNSPIFSWQISGKYPPRPLFRPTDPWNGDQIRGQTLMVDHPLSISKEYWNNFDWLRDLRESKDNNSRQRARELYLDWFSQNSSWNEISWDPKTLSNRIINILLCYGCFAETADDDFQENLMNNFAIQSRCLEIDYEKTTPPHNRFLYLCGLFSGRIALTKLEPEIKDILNLVIQNVLLIINQDGMHVSRQPQKHFEVLKRLIELRNISSNHINTLWENLNEIINKMILIGKIFRHSNGSIAEFNGGCNFELKFIDQILNKVKSPLISNKFSNDGYINIKANNSTLIFDCGTPKSDLENFYAGTLSFEFCYRKEMIIINCGSNTKDKEWFSVLKGTSAHSTLNIDNFNSTSNQKNNKRIANVLNRISGENDNQFFVEASHDGYKISHGIIHKRRLELNENGSILKGTDEIIYLDGFPKFPLEANVRFHLSPKIKASKVLGGDILLRLPNKEGWFFRTKLKMVYLEKSVKFDHLKHYNTKQIMVIIPLSDLKNRGSKKFEWKLFKN